MFITDSTPPSSVTRATGAWWYSMQLHVTSKAILRCSNVAIKPRLIKLEVRWLLQRQWQARHSRASNLLVSAAMHLQQFWCTIPSAPGHLSHCMINASSGLTIPMYRMQHPICAFRNKNVGKLQTSNTKCCQSGSNSPLCVSNTRCYTNYANWERVSNLSRKLCQLVLLHAAMQRSAMLYGTVSERFYCYTQLLLQSTMR